MCADRKTSRELSPWPSRATFKPWWLSNDALMVTNRSRIVAFAATHRLPAIYGYREFPDEGGLMSYGVDVLALFERGAVFVEKILKGAKPADLHVEQPTKLELVINLKTAKALGLIVLPTLLAQADEVIE